MNYTDDWRLGKKLDNYISDATDNGPGNDKWTSTTEQEFTVPPGKRWILLCGTVRRDASETLTVYIRDSLDNELGMLAYHAAGTGASAFPNVSNFVGGSIILDAGDYVHIICGGAQGAGASASCMVIEVNV